MKKLKAILCFFRRYHKISYFTDECVDCGQRQSTEEKGL
jgi:hypothetical protein